MKRSSKDIQAQFKASSNAGFTLIEMLVVITIIGLLMALVGPRVLSLLSQSKVRTAEIQIDGFKNSLDLYYLDVGRYPKTAEGLAALEVRPASASTWNGPYFQGGKIPNDPWGNSYQYRSPGQQGRPYEITSNGPSGNETDNTQIKSW
jgi:general secretion pathway protein G